VCVCAWEGRGEGGAVNMQLASVRNFHEFIALSFAQSDNLLIVDISAMTWRQTHSIMVWQVSDQTKHNERNRNHTVHIIMHECQAAGDTHGLVEA
jgi:hypothetical protein